MNDITLNKNYKWFITGVAGFIGSNILEYLLMHHQTIVGFDNFSTGKEENLIKIKNNIPEKLWKNFQLIKGDIRNYDQIIDACKNSEIFLHQAALGSVPRSIIDPILTNENNISGFLNCINAAKENNIKSFVFAASSSTYGDSLALPKVEENIGSPLSPYAVTKLVNELYASIYDKIYNFKSIGLRYFNVFGPRQDPKGAYAAVIPKWIHSMIQNEEIFINGDGETSRDFTYVENVIQANVKASIHLLNGGCSNTLNVAVGANITLNKLFESIQSSLKTNGIVYNRKPIYKEFRSGDVRHSLASIEKAKTIISYDPSVKFHEGIEKTVKYFLK